MTAPTHPQASLAFLDGVRGEAVDVVRRVDWDASGLGDPATWPQSLKTLVTTVLENGFPMGLAWGSQLVLVYNDAFTTVLGASKHPAAMGLGLRAVFPEAWEVIGPLLASALRGEGVALTDLPVPIAMDGVVAEHFFTFSYAPVRAEDGAVAGVLITFTETTGRLTAEQNWRAAVREAQQARDDLHDFFAQAPVPMCIVTGPDHVFALTNPPYDRFVGRSVLGHPVAKVFTPEEAGYYVPVLDRVYQTGEPVLVRESPIELTDAAGGVHRHYIDVGYHPYRDGQGRPRGVLVILQDVTESVTARRSAEEANRLKDEFLATMSHELRTPLNAILGWTTMLRAGTVREERRAAALESIERNARSQVAIVEDILDISRITTGKLRLDVAPTALRPVVEAALLTLRPAADAKGVRLELDLADDSGTVKGDAARLEQVVWNLLSNAVKFTPSGGRVDVTLRREDGQVVLTVADSGQGIAQDFLPYLFERFRQADASTTRAHGGLGLGLAIVRHLVELHGGTVEARSEGAGRGATFTLRLPAMARAAPGPP